MVDRVGFLATLEPSVPPSITWLNQQDSSSGNFGEHGDTGGTHEALGVWQYLRTTTGTISVKCVLRDSTDGSFLAVSSAVNVTSATGDWYFFPITGTFTTTTVAFFTYASVAGEVLGKALSTLVGDIMKRHDADQVAIFATPTKAITGYGGNNHHLNNYYEFNLTKVITADQDEAGDTQVASILAPIPDINITSNQAEVGDTQLASIDAVSIPTITATQAEAGDTQAALITVPLIAINITSTQIEAGDTQIAIISASANSASVTIGPRAGWDYVGITILSPTSDLVPYSTLPVIGDQIYGEILSNAVFYKRDATTFLTSAPQFAVVNIHDGSIWGGEENLVLGQANRSLSITLADINDDLLLNITDIEWGWFDELGPSSFTTLRDSGLVETTDGSGVLDIDISATKVAFGDNGSLLIESDIDFGEGVVKASGLYRVPLL